MAKKLTQADLPKEVRKLKGPHALTRKGEARETSRQERAETPAFERAEKKLGIEGHYEGMRQAGKKKK